MFEKLTDRCYNNNCLRLDPPLSRISNDIKILAVIKTHIYRSLFNFSHKHFTARSAHNIYRRRSKSLRHCRGGGSHVLLYSPEETIDVRGYGDASVPAPEPWPFFHVEYEFKRVHYNVSPANFWITTGIVALFKFLFNGLFIRNTKHKGSRK